MKGIVKNMVFMAAITGAAAAQAGVYDSQTVRYSTARLDSHDGRAAVYRELQLAVQAVCGPTSLRKAGSLYQKAKNVACAEEKLDEMIEQIGHRELTELHRQTGVVVGD